MIYKQEGSISISREASKQHTLDELKLLRGISRLPLKNNSALADEVQRIYGEAKKDGK
ncbi:MAG: hypothetical protein JXB29_06900 [Sedimentisphaerales bacterium]|nr:hypothetical protein [Sedimentisphaerales bacterium]